MRPLNWQSAIVIVDSKIAQSLWRGDKNHKNNVPERNRTFFLFKQINHQLSFIYINFYQLQQKQAISCSSTNRAQHQPKKNVENRNKRTNVFKCKCEIWELFQFRITFHLSFIFRSECRLSTALKNSFLLLLVSNENDSIGNFCVVIKGATPSTIFYLFVFIFFCSFREKIQIFRSFLLLFTNSLHCLSN